MFDKIDGSIWLDNANLTSVEFHVVTYFNVVTYFQLVKKNQGLRMCYKRHKFNFVSKKHL